MVIDIWKPHWVVGCFEERNDIANAIGMGVENSTIILYIGTFGKSIVCRVLTLKALSHDALDSVVENVSHHIQKLVLGRSSKRVHLADSIERILARQMRV
jgi:hypothetical protein